MRMKGSSSPFQRTLLSAAVASCFITSVAFANPTGPAVVNGTVNFHRWGDLLEIANPPGQLIQQLL